MPTYLIADIRVINQQRYEEYRLLVRDAVLGHGGRYVVRTSAVEVVEGGWAPPRLVVIEFPTRGAAEAFYDSPDYRQARDLRTNATMMDMVLVDGVASAALPDAAAPRAYAIADTRVVNRARFEQYLELLGDTVTTAHGRHLIRSEAAQVLEGSWEPQLLWMVEFADVQGARAAYQAMQRRELRDLVVNSAMVDLVLVQGLTDDAAPNSTFL
jgi:uncharacterized protein (DUF1330 family)